jgi:hypothetical protein
MMEVTYMCRSPQKKAVTDFILVVITIFIFIVFFYRDFGRFVTRGVRKRDKT